MKRPRRWPGILMFGLIYCGLLVFFLFFYLRKNFGNLTPGEFVFHLKVPLTGTASGQQALFFREVLFPSLFDFFLIRALYKRLMIAQKAKLEKGRAAWPPGRARRAFLTIGTVLSLLIFSAAGAGLGVTSYLREQTEYSNFIADNYVDPKSVKLQFPAVKRNLIRIYVESLETAYAGKDQGGAAAADLLPGLTALAEEGLNFSNGDKLGGAYQVPGTGWTSAGMAAQSDGLPLSLPLFSRHYSYLQPYLPGAVTLGDILADNGYRQAVLFGSDASFGARDIYFRQHGNAAILDYGSALAAGKLPAGYRAWWGYEDAKLFRFAEEQAAELAQGGQPFCLTLLTSDTHSPDGYLEDGCPLSYPDRYSNVISCSDRQLTDFVKWVQAQPFYANTTVIITGDHLSMETGWFRAIDPGYVRTTFNVFLNPAVGTSHIRDRSFTPLDLFPTTLAALGVQLPGSRLALGTDLFSGLPTLTEQYGLEYEAAELAKRSRFYERKILGAP